MNITFGSENMRGHYAMKTFNNPLASLAFNEATASFLIQGLHVSWVIPSSHDVSKEFMHFLTHWVTPGRGSIGFFQPYCRVSTLACWMLMSVFIYMRATRSKDSFKYLILSPQTHKLTHQWWNLSWYNIPAPCFCSTHNLPSHASIIQPHYLYMMINMITFTAAVTFILPSIFLNGIKITSTYWTHSVGMIYLRSWSQDGWKWGC